MRRVLVIFFALLASPNLSADVDYSLFNSIEELIDYETKVIFSHASYDYIGKSRAHVSRGESYLISDQAEKALIDFLEAYELSFSSSNEEERFEIVFRSLFGMIIAYSNLDMETTAIEASGRLNLLLDFLECNECEEKKSSSTPRFGDKVRVRFGVNIEGPDYNIPGWCEEVVTGTAGAMRAIAACAKTKKVRIALLAIIDALEVRCLKCCATGEFWKTCVTPIAEKWKQWNDKWKIFGIAPDPAWD